MVYFLLFKAFQKRFLIGLKKKDAKQNAMVFSPLEAAVTDSTI